MDALPSDSLAQINVSLNATGKSGKTFPTDFCVHGETLVRSCLEKWCTHYGNDPERYSLRCNGQSVSLESSLRAISPAGCRHLAIEIIPINGDTSKSTSAVDADAAPEVPKVAVDAAPEVPKDAVDPAIHDVVMFYVEQVMNGEEIPVVRKRLHSKLHKPEKTKLLKSGVEDATATIRASEHVKKCMKLFDREVSSL